MLGFPIVDYAPLGNLGVISRAVQTCIDSIPICGLNQPVRLNLRAMDLSLHSSKWVLDISEPSETECKYFYMYVHLTI